MQDKWKVYYYNGTYQLTEDERTYDSFDEASDALYEHGMNYCEQDIDSNEYEIFMAMSYIIKI